MSRPSFPFYPDNWLNDLGLRACSQGSRAVWIDLLCLMHQGVPYGYLADASGALTLKYLASRCTVTFRQLSLALSELEEHDVFSRSDEGILYSRKMVRDEYRRMVRGHGGIESLKCPDVPRKKGILTVEPEGILSSANIVPPIKDPPMEEVEVVSLEVSNKEKPSTRANGYDPIPGWLKFKDLYPKHRINPYLDARIWIGMVEVGETEERILSGLSGFLESDQWCRDAGKYIPNAAKFLGERMFEMAPGPSQKDAMAFRTQRRKTPTEEVIEEAMKRREVERAAR